MPDNPVIVFTFSGLPGGDSYCFTNYNRFALDIMSNSSGYIPGNINYYNYGDTEPSVDNRLRPWFNTNDNHWYRYSNGVWIRPHSIPPSSDSRILWVGSENDLWSYDGGDGTDPASSPPTDSTGAMWELDEDYSGKYLAIVGTMPGGSTTSVAIGVDGGADQTTLTIENVPPHRHGPGGTGKILTVDPSDGDNAAGIQYNPGGGDSAEVTTNWTDLAGGDSGAATPFDVVPPFRGIFLAKRTARVNFVA